MGTRVSQTRGEAVIQRGPGSKEAKMRPGYHDPRRRQAGQRRGGFFLTPAYRFLPCAATASIAAFTFSGSPR